VNSSVERVGNVVQSELSLVANASDNGVTYRCEAKNKAVTAPLSESITFHVLCKWIIRQYNNNNYLTLVLLTI